MKDKAKYDLFALILSDLEPIADQMQETDRDFVGNQIERHRKYGDDTMVSPKQLQWLIDIHNKLVGTLEDE